MKPNCPILAEDVQSTSFGVSQSREAETLRGLQAVHILVEALHADAGSIGLTKKQFQTDVELELRKAGITIGTSTSGYLYVYANIMKLSGVNGFAYDVDVSFEQAGKLIRDPSILIFAASTWRKGYLGASPRRGARSAIREVVRDFVSEFINDYLTVNPITRN